MKKFPTVLVCLLLCACAADIREAVPPELSSRAQVIGLASSDIRMWGDEAPNDFAKKAKELRRQRKSDPAFNPKKRQMVNVLVLSGGGSDGAFGAGLLNGWTASGKRPKFMAVTGVSTGALIAPFAFLGPKYDSKLREFYTQYSTKDILTPTVVAGLLGNSSVSSSAPLANLIEKYMTHAVLREIAAEHNRGRRLLVGTTNLDAERSVIWDMGQIATANNSKALQLFRRILLASASIPGVFPPVLIDVEVDGKKRREMHVDGGTTDNVILLPVEINLKVTDRALKRKPKRRLYIIVNSHLNPEWKRVEPKTMSIAGRSIQTMIKQQTIGDVLKLYDFSKKNKFDFNLASVPPEFRKEAKEPFDKEYMNALFAYGEKLGKEGFRWEKRPTNL